MDIEISPRKILLAMLSIFGFLFLLNCAGIVSKYGLDSGGVYGLINLVDFDREANLPTLYSSLQLIVASLLLLVIGTRHRSDQNSYVPWLVLSFIFVFLAVDETAGLHGRLAIPVRRAFDLTGFLYNSWVVPYGIGVLVFVIIFSRFLIRLPRETATRFVIAGLVYVVGAIGLEMLGASHSESFGSKDIVYAMLYTCEESLEILGIAYFIYALLAYISSEFGFLRSTIKG